MINFVQRMEDAAAQRMEDAIQRMKDAIQRMKDAYQALLRNHKLSYDIPESVEELLAWKAKKNCQVFATIFDESIGPVLEIFTNDTGSIYLAIYGLSLARTNLKMSSEPLWILRHKGMGVLHTMDYQPSKYNVFDYNCEYDLLVLKELDESTEEWESIEEESEKMSSSEDSDIYWNDMEENISDNEDEEDEDSFFNM